MMLARRALTGGASVERSLIGWVVGLVVIALLCKVMTGPRRGGITLHNVCNEPPSRAVGCGAYFGAACGHHAAAIAARLREGRRFFGTASGIVSRGFQLIEGSDHLPAWLIS